MENERPKVGIGSLVMRKGKVLIGKRIDGHGLGTFQIAGGHLEFGESFEEAAVREATEETGLTDFEVKGVVSLGNEISFGKHYISIGVLLESLSGEPYNNEPDKAIEWQWLDPKNLPEPMFPHSEKVIKNFLEGKFYTD
jgi:8-oxo-dGTP diphosphatase